MTAILSFVISLCFFAWAGFFSAVADMVENENFFKSVFKLKNQKFWYKRESWKYARKIFGWKFDVWHISKSSMVVCLCFAVVFYKPYFGYAFDFITLGLVWNGSFNLFYNYILKSKT